MFGPSLQHPRSIMMGQRTCLVRKLGHALRLTPRRQICLPRHDKCKTCPVCSTRFCGKLGDVNLIRCWPCCWLCHSCRSLNMACAGADYHHQLGGADPATWLWWFIAIRVFGTGCRMHCSGLMRLSQHISMSRTMVDCYHHGVAPVVHIIVVRMQLQMSIW